MAVGAVEHTIDDAEFKNLAELTRGHSGCDIASLAREAAMVPVREYSAGLSLKRESAAVVVNADAWTPNSKRQRSSPSSAGAVAEGMPALRALTVGDFITALDVVTASCKQPEWSEEE